mmetsp:Transcript_40084/g.95756  ORF Transcript_40084/g.95756 Transcript_40084/m.95756 type:complete len:283 (+) Transcript_40084:698-1546(+)
MAEEVFGGHDDTPCCQHGANGVTARARRCLEAGQGCFHSDRHSCHGHWFQPAHDHPDSHEEAGTGTFPFCLQRLRQLWQRCSSWRLRHGWVLRRERPASCLGLCPGGTRQHGFRPLWGLGAREHGERQVRSLRGPGARGLGLRGPRVHRLRCGAHGAAEDDPLPARRRVLHHHHRAVLLRGGERLRHQGGRHHAGHRCLRGGVQGLFLGRPSHGSQPAGGLRQEGSHFGREQADFQLRPALKLDSELPKHVGKHVAASTHREAMAGSSQGAEQCIRCPSWPG